MIKLEDIAQLLHAYCSLYPDEEGSFPVLREQLKNHETDIFSRKNFTGHIVGDGCVLDPRNKKILMIYHATHEKWFCPGGHIDAGDDYPADAARREVLEETGVKADFVFDENKEPMLLSINSHIIPAHTGKKEPEHWHHAMTFLFLADSTLSLPDNTDDGVASARWIDIEEALQYGHMGDMISKIQLT